MTNQYFEQYKAELKEIANKISSILGENFLGFYVFGSIVMNAWDPQKSDIDFFAIIKKPLSAKENYRIYKLHKKLSTTKLGKKLEGDYADLNLLRKKNFNQLTGSVKDGKFAPNSSCLISADNILCLIQYGKCIKGVPVRKLSLKVSNKELKEAVTSMLIEGMNKTTKTNNFKILCHILMNSLCCIYALKTGNLPTKKSAVEYNKKLLGVKLYRNITQFMEGQTKKFKIDKLVVKRIINHGLRYNTL